jgi:hypothetical protein
MSHGSGGTTYNVTTPNTTFTGTVNGETINALAANDTIIGGPGYEYLVAQSAGDTLEGAVGSVSFTAARGSSNTTIEPLPGLTATVPGIGVELASGSNESLTFSGLAITGNDIAATFTHQYSYTNTISSGINNVAVKNPGDIFISANSNADILTAVGPGTHYLQGSNNDTLVSSGSGYGIFVPIAGDNTLTGGSGGNYYYQIWGFNTKLTQTVHNDTITNFNTSTDVLAFELYTKGSEAPTSWNLISVNGVPSLEATLGDGMSTLTLLGVTDPSLIHMENFNPSTGVTTQLPDVPLAGATEAASVSLVGVSGLHAMQIMA